METSRLLIYLIIIPTVIPIAAEGKTVRSSSTCDDDAAAVTSPLDNVEGLSNDVSRPSFTQQPEAEVYVARFTPAPLSCQVVHAVSLDFVCNGVTVPQDDTHVSRIVDTDTGLTALALSINVTSDDLWDWESEGEEGPYLCHCRAFYRDHDNRLLHVQSDHSLVTMAYLKRRFRKEPLPYTAEMGGMAEMLCRPPEGVPPPTIRWMKDGELLELKKDRMFVNQEGSLVFEHLQTRDTGNYTCSVENIVARRNSVAAPLTVLVPPDVYLPNQRIRQSLGRDAFLRCVVTASPKVFVGWHRLNGPKIESVPGRYILETYREGKYTVILNLLIKSITQEDYGIFVCKAATELGEDTESMEVSEYD